MAVANVECPKCGTVLRPSKPLAPGKKVRCPKCETTFEVPGGGPAPTTANVVREPAKTAKPARVANPAKPPEKKKDPDDDDDGVIGTYQLADTLDDDFDTGDDDDKKKKDRKPDIEYAPDLSVKDPRGPASAALATPSALITLLGAVMCVAGLGLLLFFTWPFMFTEHGTAVTPIEARRKAGVVQIKIPKKDEESLDPEVTYKDLQDKERAVFHEMKDEDVQFRIIMAVVCVVGIAYGAVMAGSSVKMTVLESYRWSMVSSIMACVTIIGAPMGILSIMALKRDEIKEAFTYTPD